MKIVFVYAQIVIKQYILRILILILAKSFANDYIEQFESDKNEIQQNIQNFKFKFKDIIDPLRKTSNMEKLGRSILCILMNYQ